MRISQYLQSHGHKFTSFIKEYSAEDSPFYWECEISKNYIHLGIESVASVVPHVQKSLKNSNLYVVTLPYKTISKRG